MIADDALTILACQIGIPPTVTPQDRNDNLSRLTERVGAELAHRPADLVVLPELASIDYSRAAFDQLDALAEPSDGPSFHAWRDVALRHGVFVSYSFPRRDAEGTYISIGVVGPDGERVGHYDKLHLAQYGASMEKEYFRRGRHLLSYSVKGFRIAPIICYDIRIPELCRTLTLAHEVDIITHCGAYYRDESFHTWHPFAVTRALENQIFFLSLNRAGAQYGNSVFCWPWMDENTGPVAFPPHAEALRYVTVERPVLDDARTRYSFLKDRLEDYARLPSA
ncbi:MAG: carbon-nitrogen hydrolase family protein [Pseudomonadota bacterium]